MTLVERLWILGGAAHEAIDRIEALETTNELLKEGGRRQNSEILLFSDEIGRLREALREIEVHARAGTSPWISAIARAALEGGGLAATKPTGEAEIAFAECLAALGGEHTGTCIVCEGRTTVSVTRIAKSPSFEEPEYEGDSIEDIPRSGTLDSLPHGVEQDQSKGNAATDGDHEQDHGIKSK